MIIDQAREFALLQKLAFVRMAGTSQELRAAHVLCDAARACGAVPALEAFELDDGEPQQAVLEVLSPYQKGYHVTALRCCANTPPEGLCTELVYVANATEADLADVRGKLVLTHSIRLPAYKRIVEAGAAGFVIFSGSLRDGEEERDLATMRLRGLLRDSFGALPGVNLRIEDAFILAQQKAVQVRLVTQVEPCTLTSHNVVATVRGTRYPDEVISFGAHYDSVEFSTGVYDNGAGSVANMELLHYFSKNPPLRTVQFVWYGSEEIGLEGSKAFVKAHEAELKNCRLMINVDVGGPVLGYEVCKVTGEQSLVSFTDYFMKLRGYPVEVTQSTYSSDSIPFADKGVPAVNFCRDGITGGAFIHGRHDVLDYLSPDALGRTTQLLLDYADTLANAVVFPVARKMPPEMVEAVDNYLFKKEVEAAAKEKGERAAT